MPKILVVDDEEAMLMALEVLLTSQGYEVQTESDSGHAAELIRAHEPFDLLVTDIRMRPIDGMELLHLAKKEQPDLPVIMVTAFHSDEVALEAVSEGSFGYMPKPFNTERFLTAVNRALKSGEEEEPEKRE